MVTFSHPYVSPANSPPTRQTRTSTSHTTASHGFLQSNISSTLHDYTPPLLLEARDLPGPMSLHFLASLGALHPLDDSSAYLSGYADTLYGRGSIVHTICPFNTTACALTAAWVWLGKEFPDTIDVISVSHFRSLIHGRKIRVFNRKAPPHHVTAIGDLRITTPVRTACDIALLDESESNAAHSREMVGALMENYRVRPSQCLEILEENHFWHNVPRARQFFQTIASGR